jgi:hypothetical protein|uniref:Uncharacterized protein n=1 Tax=Eutreptiella gymnastica TaxID=73025 RepID=A0A6T1ZZ72_9EUGL|mmetsp:Transcript_33457/g.56016  ORF Transcript_33457/g.56016 Transcript_33457/m.56016 type:complete len:138 (-) Transcript_33457:233-646(-)
MHHITSPCSLQNMTKMAMWHGQVKGSEAPVMHNTSLLGVWKQSWKQFPLSGFRTVRGKLALHVENLDLHAGWRESDFESVPADTYLSRQPTKLPKCKDAKLPSAAHAVQHHSLTCGFRDVGSGKRRVYGTWDVGCGM